MRKLRPKVMKSLSQEVGRTGFNAGLMLGPCPPPARHPQGWPPPAWERALWARWPLSVAARCYRGLTAHLTAQDMQTGYKNPRGGGVRVTQLVRGRAGGSDPWLLASEHTPFRVQGPLPLSKVLPEIPLRIPGAL